MLCQQVSVDWLPILTWAPPNQFTNIIENQSKIKQEIPDDGFNYKEINYLNNCKITNNFQSFPLTKLMNSEQQMRHQSTGQ